MIKSRWIELLEWCVLAGIALFAIGVYLTGTDQETNTSNAPMIHIEE